MTDRETPDLLRVEAEQIARDEDDFSPRIWNLFDDFSQLDVKELADQIEAFARRQRAHALLDVADAIHRGEVIGTLSFDTLEAWLRKRAASEGTEP